MDNKNDKLIAAISEFKKVAGKDVIKIHGKNYNTVDIRLNVARRTLGSSLDLRDTIIHHDDKRVIVQCEAYLEGKHIGSGIAEEIRMASTINRTSALENCQTSAWGRCLANIGFASDGSIASAEEVGNAIAYQSVTLNKALQDLDKVSHLGNFQAWVSKNKSLFEKLKTDNPIAYQSFLEKYTRAKTNLETKGVINGNRK